MSYGGLFEITMESSSDDDFFYDWFIPSKKFGTPIKNGVIEFYDDGEDQVPFKRMEFWDGWVTDISETMSSTGRKPMIIRMRISAATVRYNKSVVVQKNWFQTQVTKSVDSAPMPAPAAVKANSNSLGKIAEKALGTLATAAAAALSKKSTQDALKAKVQEGLGQIGTRVTKDVIKEPSITQVYWKDFEGKLIIDTLPQSGTVTLFVKTENIDEGEKIEFIVITPTGKEQIINATVRKDGIGEVKFIANN